MNIRISVILPMAALVAFSNVAAAHWSAAAAQPRADVNFAFGGATTNSANATEAFAERDQNTADLLRAIRSKGLDVIGVTQQLDFATATLNDVEQHRDLFWLYAGANNYLAGGQDPAVAPAEIGVALERLYAELGARLFVVPNLPSIGDAPLFRNESAQTKILLNSLVVAHNQILAGVIKQFQTNHPDALVITVDVYSVFETYKTSGQFEEISLSCEMVVPTDSLVIPGACDGFLFLDGVHPASAAWEPVAQLVADALQGEEVDRIITIGDSLSDLGSLSDTIERAVGVAFPPPPFTAGRFTEGRNVIEQVEALVGVSVPSAPFAQPFRASETFGKTAIAATFGSVYVPKELTGDAEIARARVRIHFETSDCTVKCVYRHDGQGTFHLKKCSQSVSGGDLIDTLQARVKPSRHVQHVTIDWLYY